MWKLTIKTSAIAALALFGLLSSQISSAYAACFGSESLKLNTLTSEPLPRATQRFIVELHGLVDDASVQYGVRYYDATLSKRPPTKGPGSTIIYFPDKYPDWELDLKSGLPAGSYRFELIKAGRVGPITGAFQDICAATTITVAKADGSLLNPPISNVQTGLGSVSSDLGELLNQLFGLALGIAGGLAILRIIIGGFKVATSAGDPKALDEGRAIITSSIVGLVFILLATTILSIIGIDILGLKNFLPGSGGSLNINP